MCFKEYFSSSPFQVSLKTWNWELLQLQNFSWKVSYWYRQSMLEWTIIFWMKELFRSLMLNLHGYFVSYPQFQAILSDTELSGRRDVMSWTAVHSLNTSVSAYKFSEFIFHWCWCVSSGLLSLCQVLLGVPPPGCWATFIDPPWGPRQSGIHEAHLRGQGLPKQDPGMRPPGDWIRKEQEGTQAMSPQGASDSGDSRKCNGTYPLPTPGTAFPVSDFSSEGLTSSMILRGLFTPC